MDNLDKNKINEKLLKRMQQIIRSEKKKEIRQSLRPGQSTRASRNAAGDFRVRFFFRLSLSGKRDCS